MKIYYWTPYMGTVSGTIKGTINSAIALKKRGHDVKIYRTYREWEGFEELLQKNGIEIIDFKMSHWKLPIGGIKFRFSITLISLHSIGRLKKNIEMDKPDIVITGLLGYLPLFIRKICKHKPLIINNIQGKPKFHSVRKWVWKILYSGSDYINTLTEKTKEELIEKIGINPEKISVISNPIIDDRIQELSKEMVSEEIFKANEPIIIGVGRLTRQKDFKTLIDAFAIVEKKLPCRLLLIGDGEEREELEKKVAELGLDIKVYMPGFSDNPYKYIANSDVFVLSSLWEDAGHILVESAHLRIPIVSTRCPYGQEEFLEYGEAGELCEVGNAEEMAAKILDILGRKESERTRQQVERAYTKSMEYSIDMHGDKMNQIVQKMCK